MSTAGDTYFFSTLSSFGFSLRLRFSFLTVTLSIYPPHHAPPLPFLRQSPISLLPMVGWFDCFRSCLFLSTPLPCLSPLTSHALTLLSPPPFLFQSPHLLLPPLSTGSSFAGSLSPPHQAEQKRSAHCGHGETNFLLDYQCITS